MSDAQLERILQVIQIFSVILGFGGILWKFGKYHGENQTVLKYIKEKLDEHIEADERKFIDLYNKIFVIKEKL